MSLLDGPQLNLCDGSDADHARRNCECADLATEVTPS